MNGEERISRTEVTPPRAEPYEDEVEVAVVGAGPVGLTAAAMLVAYGIRTVVLDVADGDLGTRVRVATDHGGPHAEEASRLFGVSLATIGRYPTRRRGTVEVAPRPSPGRTAGIWKNAEERQAPWEQTEADTEASPEQHREAWESQGGVRVRSQRTRSGESVGRSWWTISRRTGATWCQETRGGAGLRGIFLPSFSKLKALPRRERRGPTDPYRVFSFEY